ncbi:AWPM-19-like family [Carex littledalei]|uniref:AWPM-19-like family n=1 Tax=Carex littledalei TaxID=544730 RepID=A0A833VMP6_9POAL|nr:AWPM-19-like family [Carex littledalei]
MANEQMRPAVSFLLLLNFFMYLILALIGGWAINKAIDHGFIIGPELVLPAHFKPIFFPIGNFATGFFVFFAVIAGAVGAASAISGFNHMRFWNYDSLQPAAATGLIAWLLTLLAMGFGIANMMQTLNLSQRTMEAFTIILSATQFLYIAAIHGGNERMNRM